MRKGFAQNLENQTQIENTKKHLISFFVCLLPQKIFKNLIEIHNAIFILVSTSLGVWATIDMLSSDENSESSNEETATDQLTTDEDLESTDNYLQLGDKNNVVGYDAVKIENYADMRGDDTIIGGSEKDLI